MKKEQKSKVKRKEILENVIERNVPSTQARRWIKQPINMTLLRGDVTRHQLNYIVNTIDALQSQINEYLSRPESERQQQTSLFAQHEQIPVIRIPLQDMGVTPQHYDSFEAASQVAAATVYEVEENRNGVRGKAFMPLFSKIWIPRRGLEGSGRRSGEVEIHINPAIAGYVFDMTRYNRYLKDVVMQCSGKHTARIYMFINANKFTEDKCWKVKYVELRRMLGADVVEDPNKKPPTWITAKYPRYQNFRQRVLQDSKNEIDALAAEGKVDCTFTFTEEYPAGRKNGDPKYILFNISITEFGRKDANEQQESRLAHNVGVLLTDYFGFTTIEVLRLTRRMGDLDVDVITAEIERIHKYIDAHPDIQNHKAYATAVLQDFVNSHIQEAEVIQEVPADTLSQQEVPDSDSEKDSELLRLGWQAFCEAMRGRIGEEQFNVWFSPLRPVSLSDDALVVSAPSNFVIEHIEDNYLEELRTCIYASFRPDIKLNYQVG